jgi:hypothetical protein
VTNVKVAKREIYLGVRVILNGSLCDTFRLVLDNSCTFEEVTPILMELITEKVDNLGENRKFKCSVNGAVLQKNQKIVNAIDYRHEIVEFELTCDVKVSATVYLDGLQKKNVVVNVSTHDTYFHFLKNVKEAIENRKDFNAQRYRIDYNASNVFLNGEKRDKKDRVLQKIPPPNAMFVVRLMTERVELFQFVSSFF